MTYRDYSEWEREWMAGPAGAARLDYWRGQLTDLPTLELPLDFPRPPVQRFVGRVEAFSVPTETVEALRALAGSLHVTFFQVLAACYAVLLHRYTGQEEVVFGVPNDLRQRPELRSVVGMSLTPVVLRCSLAGNPSFAETARRVSSAVVEAISNVVPFASVVRAVQPERDPGLNSLFQAIMTLEPAMLSPDPAWSLHQLSGDLGTSKFDVSVEFDERPDGHIAGRVVLNSELFEAEAGGRIVGHLRTLFDSVIADPEQPVERLGLLTADEMHRQLVEWNATDVDFAGPATVHELVRQQSLASPAAVALEFEELTMSYGELEAAADGVAARLRTAGVRRGDVVALYCRRSLEAPIGMLGIMKAGAAYLPLDPRLPPARIALMVGDAAATVMLCEEALVANVGELGIGEVAVVPLGLPGPTAEPTAAEPADPADPAEPAGDPAEPAAARLRRRPCLCALHLWFLRHTERCSGTALRRRQHAPGAGSRTRHDRCRHGARRRQLRFRRRHVGPVAAAGGRSPRRHRPGGGDRRRRPSCPDPRRGGSDVARLPPRRRGSSSSRQVGRERLASSPSPPARRSAPAWPRRSRAVRPSCGTSTVPRRRA